MFGPKDSAPAGIVIDAVPAVRIAEAEEKEPLVKTTDPVGIGLPTPSATVTATETDCDDRILKAAGVTLQSAPQVVRSAAASMTSWICMHCLPDSSPRQRVGLDR